MSDYNVNFYQAEKLMTARFTFMRQCTGNLLHKSIHRLAQLSYESVHLTTPGLLSARVSATKTLKKISSNIKFVNHFHFERSLLPSKNWAYFDLLSFILQITYIRQKVVTTWQHLHAINVQG